MCCRRRAGRTNLDISRPRDRSAGLQPAFAARRSKAAVLSALWPVCISGDVENIQTNLQFQTILPARRRQHIPNHHS